MEQTTALTADELLAILLSLGTRAVITKNKDPELERNYRRQRRDGLEPPAFGFTHSRRS